MDCPSFLGSSRETVQLCPMMMLGGIFWSLPFCGVAVQSSLHTLCFLPVRIKGAKSWTPDGRLKFSWLMHQCCLFSLRTAVFRPICSGINFLDSNSKQPFCCHLCPNDILDAGIQFSSHLSFLFSVVNARLRVHFRNYTNSPEQRRAVLKTGG